MNINEIFTSLSGEADGFGLQGGLATFVRLQGCNLKCKWCDTKYAADFRDWEEISVAEVMKQCTTRHIIITGGEPLLQSEEVAQLIEALIKRSFSINGDDYDKHTLITIETNGSLPITIEKVRCRYILLRFVVDYKLDSSGMGEHMLPEVFDYLFPLDVIKFVIADLQDYRQAKELIWRHPKWCAKKVFSPIASPGWPAALANAMVEDKLENVQFSLQWHKVLKVK